MSSNYVEKLRPTEKVIYSSRPQLVENNPYLTESNDHASINFKTEETLINLNGNELRTAASIGSSRQIMYLTQPSKTGYTGPGWSMSITGACGELAVAKFLGIYYNPIISVKPNSCPVGKLNIRTSLMVIPTLVIRQMDLTNKNPFVLVAGCDEPNYYITGWAFVKDVIKDCYFKQTPGKPGVFMVPYQELQPISRLPDEYLEEDDTSEENYNS